ncbi:MAG: signal peptidase II [Acidimicrobiales bacterium]
MTWRHWGWGVAGIVLALSTDLVSTTWALGHLSHHRVEAMLGGLVKFKLVANTGAAFGIGAGHEPVIALLEVVTLAALVFFVARAPTPLVAFCLGGAAGSGLGNLIDRIVGPHGAYHGAVVDWIHVNPYPPIFNLADVWLRVGLLVAAGAMLVRSRRLAVARRSMAATGPGSASPESR